MKKCFSSILRILPVLFLIFALFLSAFPFQASAVTNAVDWFDHFHSLYQADVSHAGAYVYFDRTDCTWVYLRSDTGNYATFTGISADIRTFKPVEIRPFGNQYLDLKEIPLGTMISTGFEFKTDVIYSSSVISYFTVLRYFDENGNQVHQVRSNDSRFSFNSPDSPTGIANVYFNFTLNGVTDQDGNVHMPRYCTFEIHLSPGIENSIIGSLSDLSCFIPFDDNLQVLLSDDRKSELMDISITYVNNNGFTLSEREFYCRLLDPFFNLSDIIFDDPVDITGLWEDLLFFIKDGFLNFRLKLDESLQFLTSLYSAFGAVRFLFDIFLSIPFISSVVICVLVFASFALFFSISLNAYTSATKSKHNGTSKRNKSSASGGKSSSINRRP